MDSQSKLSKNEWTSIEKSVDNKEKQILELIVKGYNDPSYSVDLYFTMEQVIKLEHPDKDYYIYINIIKETVDKMIKLYKLPTVELIVPKKKLNGADTIRIQSQKKKHFECIEFYMLDLMEKFFKDKKKEFYFYNICILFKKYSINKYLCQLFDLFIKKHNETMDIIVFLEHTSKYIENNSIYDYKPLKLYEHQIKIYEAVKTEGPKLIFYRAPTSSGKTLTPLGLCEQYKVIFICASRHIGINLSKSGVNIGRKVGFAFGCDTIADVRLHYFSVNTFITAKGRKRPDHSDGSKLEMLICDIQSYEIAMLYMLSFFEKEKIIIFWDEPNISMNNETHVLHESIKHIWSINQINNIVLSSATLPNYEELSPMIEKFNKLYKGTIHYIETQDETTNITLLDTEGNIIMPHNIFPTVDKFNEFIDKHAYSHSKYLSVVECADFVLYMCRNVFNASIIKEEFPLVQDITSQKIRDLYYKVCRKIKPSEWSFVIHSYNSCKKVKRFDIGNEITTKYSHSLTYGPTIYLCQDIDKWINYFVDNSSIHVSVFNELEKNIDSNNDVIDKMNKMKKIVEDKTLKDEENENKMKEQRFDPAIKQIIGEIELMEKSLKDIQLNPLYIPNSKPHFEKWNSKDKYEGSNVFTSNVDEQFVRRIMKLSIDTNYKILLLMGIGIFNPTIKLDEYNDIMKELADQKQLLFIIAGSEYINGTNYQFYHGYLADDILNINQETIIQSIGRVGRKEKNRSFTFRFRDNKIIELLFIKKSTLEVDNINSLFF
uniref:Uncharacterized protein n=1 Tax=viral metagenome TaxID=1070528 RepID=A0A6C0ETF8_9ZZZZ